MLVGENRLRFSTRMKSFFELSKSCTSFCKVPCRFLISYNFFSFSLFWALQLLLLVLHLYGLDIKLLLTFLWAFTWIKGLVPLEKKHCLEVPLMFLRFFTLESFRTPILYDIGTPCKKLKTPKSALMLAYPWPS